LRSSVWIGLKEHVFTIRDNSHWIIGTVTNISFWTDNWLGTTILLRPKSLLLLFMKYQSKYKNYLIRRDCSESNNSI
jgi:hypothetical protein